MRTSTLEEYGVRAIMTPQERLLEYKKQCRGMSKRLQAKWWLMIIEKDPEVAKLIAPNRKKHRRTKEMPDEVNIPEELTQGETP